MLSSWKRSIHTNIAKCLDEQDPDLNLDYMNVTVTTQKSNSNFCIQAFRLDNGLVELLKAEYPHNDQKIK